MATKTLRVTLADIAGLPAGPAGRIHSGDVWVEPVDGDGAPYQVRYTDGTVALPARVRRPLDASGVADFIVVPSDDSSVHVDDRGFGLRVGWDLKVRGARGASVDVKSAGKVIQVLAADTAVVQFGSRADYGPVLPGASYPSSGDMAAAIAASATLKEDKRATYRAVGGDEGAAFNTWIASAVAGEVDVIGSISTSVAIVVPANKSVNFSAATITRTGTIGAAKVGMTVAAGAKVRGGTLAMPAGDYTAGQTAYTQIGVDLIGAGASVTGMTVTGAGGIGVRVSAVDDAEVANNTIIGPGSPAIPGGDGVNYGVLVVDGDRAKIVGNRVSEVAQGIAADSTSLGTVISGNIIRNVRGQHGMYVHRTDGGRITDNDVADCYFNGIKVQIDASVTSDVTGFVVADNTVARCGRGGGGAVDAIVISNAVSPYTRKFRGLTVTGNSIDDCARGFTIGSVRGATVAGNVVSRVDGNAYAFQDCEDVTLNLGQLITIGGSAVVVNALGSTTNKRITIGNGRVYNYGNAGGTAIYGVHIVTGTDITIDGVEAYNDNGTASYVLYHAGTSAEQQTLSVRDLYVNATAAQGARLVSSGRAPRLWRNVNVGTVLNYPTAYAVRFGDRGGQAAMYAANALPTADVFKLADEIVNGAPAVGSPKSWVCTVAGGLHGGTWAATTAYAVGDWRRNGAGRVYEATTAGTSGATGPVGTTIGGTETDGTVVWTCRSLTPATFVSTGNL